MNSYYRIVKKQPRRRNWLFRWITSLNLTGYLILLNILFFVLVYLVGIFVQNIFGISINNYLALQANNLFLKGYVWTLLTSVFMHANIFHLFVNMFSLYFLGSFLEMIIGRKRFIWFYIFSGIFAALFFVVLAFLLGNSVIGAKLFSSPETFAVGASGVIFAIAGVLAVLTPRNRVYLILGPLLAIVLESILYVTFKNATILVALDWLITIYILFSLFSLMSFNPRMRKISLPVAMPFWLLPIVAIVPLVIIGLFIPLPIGNTAHLGGFIFGALYGFYLRKKYKKKTQMISQYFSGRQN